MENITNIQKIGYCFYINFTDFTWNGEKGDFCLDVNVLFDNKVKVSDGFSGVWQYLRVYIDVDNEKLGLDITENEYFDRVKVDHYDFVKVTPYMELPRIDMETADQIIKGYCQQIKASNIDIARVDIEGEQCAYWMADTY